MTRILPEGLLTADADKVIPAALGEAVPAARRSLAPYLPHLGVDWCVRAAKETWRTIAGTLVFCDVSGFTSISERLARQGRIGAEELTDMLDACFTDLLGVAYAEGGSLIKFGGDALLLFFSDAGHPARACRATLRMRRKMRAVEARPTSVGKVRLRMSVGVHSAEFHFFRVGGSHRELIVTGPAATATMALETAAGVGEILVSPETAAAVPSALVGARKGPGRLLRDVTVDLTVDRSFHAPQFDPGIDVTEAIPLALRAHLHGGEVEPEHRQASIAFVRFEGVDALLARSGPAAVAGALDDLVKEAQAAADEYGVTFLTTDIDRDGGKVVLASGVPCVLGDDEGRMLRVLRRIADSGSALPVRIGVNRGPVFVGDVGPPYRRTYTLMGDAVNVAARLMSAAGPGEILATIGVLDRSRTVFELTGPEPLHLRGKAKPVATVAVGPERREAVRTRPAGQRQLPLVGRVPELEALSRLLTAARNGRGAGVEMVGEPGIGKSRLAEEARHRADDMVVATSACEAYESSTPYFPFARLLRDVLGIPPGADADEAARTLTAEVLARAPALGPWAPLLGVPLNLELPATPETVALEPRSRRDRTNQVTVELMSALLASPTLMVIEDVQWMDEASADLLGHLMRSIEAHPWAVLVTRRHEAGGFQPRSDGPVLSLAIPPLTTDEAAELIAAATDHMPLRQHELDAVVGRGGGNPLFIEELLRTGAGGESLPETLAAVVSAQIDRLPPAPRRLLCVGAVLGPSFERRLLEELLEIDAVELRGLLAELADFLEPDADTRLVFRHRLIRDVAYEGLAYRRRRELHARAGSVIERMAGAASDHAELLSLHFLAAQRHPEAWRYAVLAGDRARAKYANVDAAELYERGVAAAKHLGDVAPAELVAVWEALGDVRLLAGLYEEAGTAYRAARLLLDQCPAQLGRLFLKQARVAERQGRYSGGVRWVLRGLRLLDGLDDPACASQRAQLSVWYAAIRQRQGRHREAVRWCERAVKEATAGGDRLAFAQAYRVLDWAYMDLGRADLATHSAAALAIYEELNDLSGQAEVLNNLGGFAYYQGQWEEALALYARSREAKQRTGNLVDAAAATANMAEILADQGRLDEAEASFREALQVWRAVGYPRWVAFATMHLGRVASRRGRFDEALRLLAEARRGFTAIEAAAEALETDVWTTECLLLQGESRRALALADEVLRRHSAMGGSGVHQAILHRLRGYAFAQLGQLVEGWAALDESLTAARARGAPFEVALTLEALSVVAPLAGRPYQSSESDHRLILERLGVTWMPSVVLPVAELGDPR